MSSFPIQESRSKHTVCLMHILSNFVLAMGKYIANINTENYIFILIATFIYPLVQKTA